MIKALKTNELYNKIDLQTLKFKTTNELKSNDNIIGQERAFKAINTALGIDYDGYNLFVMGNSGTGRHFLVEKLIQEQNKKIKNIYNWCYVNNFDNFNKPISVKLPRGMGIEFKNEMEKLIETLKETIPLIFNSQQYLTKKQSLEYTLKELQDKEFIKIKEEAKLNNVFVNFTNKGITLSPLKNGKVLNQEEYVALNIEEREILDKKILEYTEIIDENAKVERELNQEYLEKFTLIEQILMLALVDNDISGCWTLTQFCDGSLV